MTEPPSDAPVSHREPADRDSLGDDRHSSTLLPGHCARDLPQGCGFRYLMAPDRGAGPLGDSGPGVGGLAVALAAQDTIKHFFGSLVLFADKPFQVGDRITVIYTDSREVVVARSAQSPAS